MEGNMFRTVAITVALIGFTFGDDGTPRKETLRMGKLDIDVDISGASARTVVTAQFQNPSSRPVEGDFTFDMPRGSLISGYALDIGGQMVDGVLVGQRQAKQAFEAQVRRGVDPGIAQVTRSGAFKTRVFPIFAH